MIKTATRKNTKLAVVLGTLVLVLNIAVTTAETRKWSSANGKFDVTAELIDVDGESVKLKRNDGKVFDVKLSVLSQEDRDFVANLRQKSKPRVLTLPGVMSIANPGDGFTWQSGGRRVTEGIQAFRLGCGKEGSTSSVTLQLELRKAASDRERSEAVQSDYQRLLQLFAQAKLEDVKLPNLRISPPIPDRVAYAVSAQTPDGAPFEFRVIHLFKENTYRFHVVANSKGEADMLAEVTTSLKELGTSLQASSGQMVDGRFQHVVYDFTFQPPEGFEFQKASSPDVVAQFREASGAVINIRCTRKPAGFDLPAVFSKVQAAQDGLEKFEAIDSGDMTVAGRAAKWRVISHELGGRPLRVAQYYVTNDNWVFIVTATMLADQVDGIRPRLDAAVQDIRFDI